MVQALWPTLVKRTVWPILPAAAPDLPANIRSWLIRHVDWPITTAVEVEVEGRRLVGLEVEVAGVVVDVGAELDPPHAMRLVAATASIPITHRRWFTVSLYHLVDDGARR
jgi:hypothetical protein